MNNNLVLNRKRGHICFNNLETPKNFAIGSCDEVTRLDFSKLDETVIYYAQHKN